MEIPYFMSDGKTLRNINVASGKVKEGLEEDAYQVSSGVSSGYLELTVSGALVLDSFSSVIGSSFRTYSIPNLKIFELVI